MITQRFSSNTTTAEITKCIPNVKYYARILAYNDRYDGPPSRVISFYTPEGGKWFYYMYTVI